MIRSAQRRIEFAMLIGLIASVLVSFTSFSVDCADIRARVLRLHILANSDSAADQALKLKVRDRLLEVGSGWMDDVHTEQQAEAVAKAHCAEFERAADDVILEAGGGYAASVQICPAYFETRRYNQVTLPAGVYEAVQVKLGKAEGKNWWCVMFPTMCLPSAQEQQQMNSVLDGGKSDIVDNSTQYQFRFKVLEWVEDFLRSLNQAGDGEMPVYSQHSDPPAASGDPAGTGSAVSDQP